MATFARALYTFEGSRLDNLSFKEGDIITVLKQDEGGWWRGSSLDGRIGIFPKNYVELNEVRDSYEVAVAEFDFNGDKAGDLSFKEGDEVIVLKQISQDWWRGRRKDGSEGVFPAAYVKLTGEMDHATAEEEAAKWEAIVSSAKAQGAELAKKRAAAEAALAQERVMLESANAEAFQVRMQEEGAKAAAARNAKAQAESDAAKKKQIELAKAREEQERRIKEAEENIAQMKFKEEANQAQTSAASEQVSKAKAETKTKSKKEDDERFSDVSAPTPVTRVKREEKKPPNKFAGLGGGSVCPKCQQTVGHAEKVKGPGDSSYHNNCLRCSACDKQLMGGQFSENSNMPYCSVCYGRGFGPKGFGFGGSVVADDKGGMGKDRVAAKGEIEESSTFAARGATANGKKLW